MASPNGTVPPSNAPSPTSPIPGIAKIPDGVIINPPPEVLATLPHDDRGSVVIGSTWLMIVAASIFLGLRLRCKYVGKRSLWWDDWTLIAAWVVLVTDGSLTTHMVAYFGFGKHSWDFNPPSIDSFFLFSLIRTTLALTAAAWTKSAFALTLLRLTEGWMTWLLWFILISMNLALGLSALFPWVHCKPLAKAWTFTMVDGTCWDPDTISNFWVFSGAYSAAMDFLLAILPWKLFWALQMKRHEKIGIGICMSLGAVAGATAVVKTINLPKLTTGDLYDAVDLVLWDIAEACVTMVAICIPILRSRFGQLGLSVFRPRSRITEIMKQGGRQNENGILTVESQRKLKCMTADGWHEDVENRIEMQEHHRGNDDDPRHILPSGLAEPAIAPSVNQSQ